VEKNKLAVNKKSSIGTYYFYLALTSSAWLFLTSPLWPSSIFPIVCEIKTSVCMLMNLGQCEYMIAVRSSSKNILSLVTLIKKKIFVQAKDEDIEKDIYLYVL
jgi:hypothetical protein